ncbi:DEKNAAC100606 [Brettanomyces naardenensis]|uniref:DEKNAAC100606 n=1 Tax=Brettanomyces naardenensis TaxID=13370 RepID=A0A448YGN5_BRENA|nr:DEKNAAC100606 [Brettanomyces naardenensis]
MNASYEFPRKASPLRGPQPFADETDDDDDDDRNAAGQPGRPQSDSSLRFQSPSIPAKDIDLRSGGVKEKKVVSPFNDDDDDEDNDESDDGDSSIDAFDAKFENRGQTIPQLSGDDSVDQLLTMRNQMTGASVGFKVPEIRVGDEGPSAGSMGQESSIYGNQGIKRLSTMQTNDLKIYNLPDSDTDDADDRSIERGKFDMSTIQEVTEMDDSHADLSPSSPGTTPSLNSPSNEFDVPGLTKVKLNSLESPVQADRRGDSENLMGAPSDSIHRHSLSHSSVSSKNSVVKAVFNGSESSDDSSPSATRKSESLDSTIDGASMARPLKAEQQKPKVRANLKSSCHGQDAKNAADKEERDKEEKEEEEVKYPPGKGPCRKCHKPILPGQKSIWSKDNQLSGQWHRRCFSCYACSTKFSKGQSCYVYNDRPYCETHFHELNGSLCRICGKGVEGECLQNEVNEVFHMDCLKCSYCGVPIRTDYFIYNGQVMCENDAKEQMMLMREGNNGAESDKVVKRRTRMMYV